MTTGPAVSATRDGTGCVGSTMVRGPCCGAATKRSMCFGSPSPPTPAATPVAEASFLRRSTKRSTAMGPVMVRERTDADLDTCVDMAGAVHQLDGYPAYLP